MTRIEKAVKIVSDLDDFYRRIPKISEPGSGDRKKTKTSSSADDARTDAALFRKPLAVGPLGSMIRCGGVTAIVHKNQAVD
jgi:hypothetical protein